MPAACCRNRQSTGLASSQAASHSQAEVVAAGRTWRTACAVAVAFAARRLPAFEAETVGMRVVAVVADAVRSATIIALA